jgi:hypothetical protein
MRLFRLLKESGLEMVFQLAMMFFLVDRELSWLTIGYFGSDVSISSDVQMGGALPVVKVSVHNDSLSVSLSGAGSVSADLTLHAKKDSASFDTSLSVGSLTRLGSCLSVLANCLDGRSDLGLGVLSTQKLLIISLYGKIRVECLDKVGARRGRGLLWEKLILAAQYQCSGMPGWVVVYLSLARLTMTVEFP